MTLTRRELLRVLGATAAGGAMWSMGCRPPPQQRLKPRPGLDDLRAALRAAVAQVRERHASASGWAALRERTTLIAGSGERGSTRRYTATVVLRAGDAAGRTIERVIGDGDPEAIATLAAELAGLGAGGGRTLVAAAAEDHAGGLEQDPSDSPPEEWMSALDATLARAEALGSSRIVWRAAHATIDDEHRWFVGDGRDVAQHQVRVRSGVSLMAWSGTRPMIGEVVAARTGGLEALALEDAQIQRAADRALELLTPGAAPAGVTAMVLDPSVVGAVIATGVAGVLEAARWRRPDLRARALLGLPIAGAGVTIVDDPTSGGFAGYAVDDEGWPAARTALIDAGVVTAVLSDELGAARAGVARTGHGRRGHGDGAAAARPSDLLLAPGTASGEELLAAIGDGVLIEDADGVEVDPASWRITVRARRARKVAGGKLTGHAWTDIELRAGVPELLTGLLALGADVTTHVGPLDDGPPLATTAPALATLAELAPRRQA